MCERELRSGVDELSCAQAPWRRWWRVGVRDQRHMSGAGKDRRDQRHMSAAGEDRRLAVAAVELLDA